jgi:hypothetical protein
MRVRDRFGHGTPGYRATGRSSCTSSHAINEPRSIRLAMLLNDEADDAERQLLLPFVTRLACADTKADWEREVYIAQNLSYRMRFQDRLEALEGALAIARRADVMATEEVRSRLETVQQSAKPRTSVADHLDFSKIKAWLVPTL